MPTPFVYEVNEPAAASPPSAGVVALRTVSSPIDAFLGHGLVHPLVRNQKNDFASASGEELVRSCVTQVLGTRSATADTGGELRWRGGFGSRLHMLKHRKGHIVEELGRAYILDAIRQWEPRVVLSRIEPEFDREQRLVSFRVWANMIDENVTRNRVLLSQDVEVSIAL